jgi:hypothetical protein
MSPGFMHPTREDVLYARARRRTTDVQRILFDHAARRLLPCLLVAFMTLVSPPAMGSDPNIEKQVQALQKKAIEEDNLNLNYPEAIKKLATGISKCAGDKCSPALKGALYRDLGAMLILGGSAEDGRAAFAKALGLDPSLELDPAYKTPVLDGLWNEVKRKTGSTGGGGGAGEVTTTTPPEGGIAQQPTGDFAHVPPGAQLVRTPLPVYAEYLGTDKLVRVVVKYRGAGMSDWKPVELRKLSTGYGGLIPCKDVAEGKMQYYIQGFGTSEDPVAASGSRTKPFTVAIKTELSGPPPSLPDQEPPKQCPQTVGGTDCPPDFPGCHATKKAAGDDCARNGECESGSCASGKCAEKKGEGDECDNDNECASGSCSDGKCTAQKKGSGDSCDSDDECSSGSCKEGKCNESGSSKPGKFRRIWIGIAGSFEVVALPASDNVCLLDANASPVNTVGYQCLDPGTSTNFPPIVNGKRNSMINANIQGPGPGNRVGDAVGGGFALANVRLTVSFDYALTMNILIGARAGYVLFTDPATSLGAAFAPIHLEARGTFLVGKDALTKSIAPLFLVAAGAGEFDASIGVVVQMKDGSPRNENAWITAGPIFAAAGAGLRFLIAPTVAATVAIKGQGAFGGSAGALFSVAPELGVQLGF